MLKHKVIHSLAVILALGVIATGCGSTKQINSTEVPVERGSEQAPAKASMKHADRYVVKRRDTLWAIAGKANVYGDSFEWPLLYKTNRDKIQDPDLIYPKQTFSVERSINAAEKKHAEELADKTPQYQPHDKPREKQMVSYF